MSRNAVLYVILAALTGAALSAAKITSRVTRGNNAVVPVVSGSLSLLCFVLGRTTLAQIQAKLGASAIERSSPADSASNALCYQSAGNDHTRVVFLSGFSGGWEVVDGFEVIGKDVPMNRSAACAKAPQITNAVHTASGLRVGLTREQVLALLGSPARITPNSLLFEWNSTQPMTSQQITKAVEIFKKPVTHPYYDVEDSIKITLRHSRVAAFVVRHTVTY